jgi:hypothetical protein
VGFGAGTSSAGWRWLISELEQRALVGFGTGAKGNVLAKLARGSA